MARCIEACSQKHVNCQLCESFQVLLVVGSAGLGVAPGRPGRRRGGRGCPILRVWSNSELGRIFVLTVFLCLKCVSTPNFASEG